MTDVSLPADLGPGWWAGVSILGFIVGVLGGMFGVGGNFILIPLLNIGFHVPLPISVGTGLCQVIGTSTASLVRYMRLKAGESLVGWIMMGGALLGAHAGVVTLAWLATLGDLTLFGHRVAAVKLVLALTFSAVLLLVAIGMARDVRNRPASSPLGPGVLTRIYIPPMVTLPRTGRTVSIPVLANLGFGLGFLNGMVGMGGGVVLLPILVYGIGMRIRTAAPTGIAMLVASAALGTYSHARLGHVHLGLAVTLLAGSTLGAPIGATIASHVDGRRLRALFTFLIGMTALVVLWDLGNSLFGWK